MYVYVVLGTQIYTGQDGTTQIPAAMDGLVTRQASNKVLHTYIHMYIINGNILRL